MGLKSLFCYRNSIVNQFHPSFVTAMKTENKIKLNRGIVAGAIFGMQMSTSPLWADDTADTINQLKKQIEELDQKVRLLERKHELEKETAVAAAKTTPVITA